MGQRTQTHTPAQTHFQEIPLPLIKNLMNPNSNYNTQRAKLKTSATTRLTAAAWSAFSQALCVGVLAFSGVAILQPAYSQTRLPAGAAEHVIVYKEPGRFVAHPANFGVWVWGDEILVGFKHSVYKDQPTEHSRDNDQPSILATARSLDGGRTWKLEAPAFIGDLPNPVPSPGGIDFQNPNLAVRIGRRDFLFSYDRGKTWKGHYQIAGLDHQLTSRTDYLVNGPRDAFFFFSSQQPQVKAGIYKDRAFTARTTDGGKTFKFVSWITHEPFTTRSVMPSTVRVSKTELVSSLRRRDDSDGSPRNWIDVYASTDNGTSWTHRSKVADTDRPELGHNGNPPAMVRLRDGRLVVAYGYRSTPYGIRAKISKDNGKTWGDDIMLRDDARTWDIGYPRMVQRADGKVVTIYYITTEEKPQQHIVATIWDPNVLGKR